jgi:hypothetical protein
MIIGPSLKVKVKMNGSTPIYELWEDDRYLGEVSVQWVVEMIHQLAGALRWVK